MPKYKVGYLVGSLATTSINRKLALALARTCRARACRDTVSGAAAVQLRLLRCGLPGSGAGFQERDSGSDAILFVCPEYNRSIPGALKNAIDWGSRPYGSNAFTRKPSAVIGASPGSIGTAVAQQHLKGVLAFCNSPLMNSPEAYIQFKTGMITDDGTVTVDSTEEFLRNYMAAFADFIGRVYAALPRETKADSA
jgi:chromate reductase